MLMDAWNDRSMTVMIGAKPDHISIRRSLRHPRLLPWVMQLRWSTWVSVDEASNTAEPCDDVHVLLVGDVLDLKPLAAE